MRTRYGEITKEILLTIALVGIVVIGATSPYFLIALAQVIIKNKKYHASKKHQQKIVRSLKGLKERGLFTMKETADGNFMVRLTEKGKRVADEINIEKLEIKKQKIWDKQWRIVIFDIPEHKKNARNALRQKLQELHFYQLQKSVFACPYPCEKEIKFLCEFFDVGHFVNIIIAGKIHNDATLEDYFKL